eukprot:TRINITY_DN155_c0_g1_i1.p1 TRINITY_DN155_c0_g1~~TRINITY_DN155_c0_g1_i1.p1  ORF type:complete len:155 (+),score=40.01 TRINITY_DN155_c0_g1_i1:94-558(+)
MAEEGNPGPMMVDAARRGNIRMLKRIVDDYGRKLSTGHEKFGILWTDGSGNTALHQAAAHDNFDCAEILLDNSAPVNAANAVGDTPLHIAVRKGNCPLVRILCDRGADKYVKNKKLQTPEKEARLPTVRAELKKEYQLPTFDASMCADADDKDA